MKSIEIPAKDLPVGKFNGPELVAAMAQDLSIDVSLIGYSAEIGENGNALSLKLEMPDSADASTALMAVANHNPAKSEIEVGAEKITIDQKLAALEARVLILEAK